MAKLKTTLYIVGAILVLAGASTKLFFGEISSYLYCVGAILFAATQICDGYTGKNFSIKRLRRQQIFGALFLLVAGATMFLSRHNEWIVFLTIAAILELYTVFRISAELDKEKRDA